MQTKELKFFLFHKYSYWFNFPLFNSIILDKKSDKICSENLSDEWFIFVWILYLFLDLFYAHREGIVQQIVVQKKEWH